MDDQESSGVAVNAQMSESLRKVTRGSSLLHVKQKRQPVEHPRGSDKIPRFDTRLFQTLREQIWSSPLLSQPGLGSE